QHNVKMMVVAPVSTIDFEMETGKGITIEQRKQQEILPDCYSDNLNITAWNPVFDVTPAHLITAIVTEKGVVLDPVKKGVRNLQK
ncbi:MAG: S-methyl-5-thioribose-1-phosphate isomerase, partial [Methylococcales bacterium]|nr:S-methyl-5-thioribose-1-phosphate isomerase [Methylococcales bacterium]